mmetsp:Transcript_25596/g.67062  ORF Transcript_25596/g.67062 Transcript_25596/m.67062 type:complete len:375 (+) Transcript_25596:810-1934(+)
MFHTDGVPTLGSPRVLSMLTPPFGFGDSVVPRSPTMLTPVLDSAMMAVMEKSGPDFFIAEGSEVMAADDVGLDYSALYPACEAKPSGEGFGSWSDELSEEMRFDSEADARSPMVPDMFMMGGLVPRPGDLSASSSPGPALLPTPPSPDEVCEIKVERTVSGNSTQHNAFHSDSALAPAPAAVERAEPAPSMHNGRALRRGRRARRPPGEFRLGSSPTTPRVQHRRPGTVGGGAGKATSTAASTAPRKQAKAASKAAAKAALGGGVRKRPTAPMSVEERVLAIFGEETLRLDRDAFKIWRAATELPTLTSSEQVALKRLRRRLLGRTYAKRSRDRQVAHASSVEAECDKLKAENAAIRKRISRLQRYLDETEPGF